MSYDSGLSDFSFNSSEAVAAIEEALTLVKDNLTEFVASETFEADMVTVFGDSADVELAETIIGALTVGGGLPEITVVPEEQMNGANGGYDPLTGEVYLADSLIDESPQQVADVLAEEFGHLLDSEINEFDSTGDEGEYFAAVVRGDELSVEEIESLRGEDDTVVILDGLVVVEANQVVSFSEPTNFDVGEDPRSVAVGDFNGDDRPDLAVTNSDSNNVSVLLGNGDGSFSKASNFAVDDSPFSVAVGEFNGDDRPDLAVMNLISSNVSVLLGKGDGSFKKPVNYEIEGTSDSVAVGEFNGDGISDLVTQGTYTSVLLGKGDGSFSEPTVFDEAIFGKFVAVGEFNGDGILDLAVANEGRDKVSVLLGKGDGSFSEFKQFDVGDRPRSLAVGEFNGDGISDLAVANHSSDNVSVLLGKGDGSFKKATNYNVEKARSVAVADFSGDGISDLAVTNGSVTFVESVSVLLGKGDGSFKKATNFNLEETPSVLAVGEFNGDDRPDLAVVKSLFDDKVSVLLNTTPPPEIAVSNTRITEGEDGSKNAKFTVTLDKVSGETIKVNYATDNGSAKAGKDYRKTNGTLTFKPGETKNTITVPILGDTLDESNEKFQVNLSKPRNADLGDKRGIATIRDNDRPPTISIADESIAEGNRGRKNARFTVTLDEASEKTVRVNYATADGSAKAGKDYRKATGTVIFKPGQTKKTITVPVLGDTLDESNEKFQVNLRKPNNAKLGDKRGIGTINDNDKVVRQLSIKNATVTEGDDGSKDAKFVVTLNAKADRPIRVNYATGNGTADAGEDYTRTKGTLTFKSGERKKTITVPVLGDIIGEENEKFQVTLSKPRNAKFRDKRGIGTIRDND